jgi:hypothetical protein
MFIILSESKVEIFFIKVLNYLHKKMGKGFSVCLYRLPGCVRKSVTLKADVLTLVNYRLKYYIVERDFRGVYEELIVSPSVTL